MNKQTNTIDAPEEFNLMLKEDQNKLLEWIKKTFKPIKTVDEWNTSYGLKHIFERSKGGFYITNGEFKGAMLNAGFLPHKYNEQNWRFRISKKSLKRDNRGQTYAWWEEIPRNFM